MAYLVYDKNGIPVKSDAYEIIGYGVPDLTGGIENSFIWKNINLSFLIDFKSGGDIYSGTNAVFTMSGLSYESLEGRDPNNPMKVKGAIQTGVTDDNEPIYDDFEHTLSPVEAKNYWNVGMEDDSSIHL